MTWSTGQIMQKIREAAVEGLGDAVGYLLEQSNKHVPIETNDLLDSGKTSVDPDALQAAVSYDTAWAVAQHERLDYVHDSGRTAKYLEKPWLGEKDELLKRIFIPIRRELG